MALRRTVSSPVERVAVAARLDRLRDEVGVHLIEQTANLVERRGNRPTPHDEKAAMLARLERLEETCR